MGNILEVKNLNVSIGDKHIVKDMSFEIPEHGLTSIIGPNGCGKSTTLKAISRIWKYQGKVLFKGEDILKLSHREFARSIAVLTQSPQAPADLTVRDLVDMGRFPYKSFLGRGTEEDTKFVDWAIEQTNLKAFEHRILNTLSGGERQRAWIAMALAQNPQVLFLDEPTTYLDICHQLEIMQLLQRLNKELGLTVVMVLHDLNHTLQYSNHLVVMKQGGLVCTGDPKQVINQELLRDVYGVEAETFTCSNGMTALVPMELTKS